MLWPQSTHTRAKRQVQNNMPNTKNSWSRKRNRKQRGSRDSKWRKRGPTAQWDKRRRSSSNPAWREHPRTIESSSGHTWFSSSSTQTPAPSDEVVTLSIRLFEMRHNWILTPAAVCKLDEESRWWRCTRPQDGFGWRIKDTVSTELPG